MERDIMKNSKMKEILKAVASESETLKLLKSSPEKLVKRFQLTEAELNALQSADMLVNIGGRNPLIATTTITFTTGSTITARPPRNLKDLTRDELELVLKNAILDRNYAEKLRRFLKLK
jgi:hypothetical protein